MQYSLHIAGIQLLNYIIRYVRPDVQFSLIFLFLPLTPSRMPNNLLIYVDRL